MQVASVEEPIQVELEGVRGVRDWHGAHGLKQIALLLWSSDYSYVFDEEYNINLNACGGGGYELPPNTYRARLKGEAAERYDWRRRQCFPPA